MVRGLRPGSHQGRRAKKKREEQHEIVSLLDPLFADTGDDLPEYAAISLSEVKKYWNLWLLWRSVEKPTFLEALSLPSRMLGVFFALDLLASRMESQKAKRDRANAQ